MNLKPSPQIETFLLWRFLLLALICAGLLSCAGGGTSGTGVRSYQGSVSLVNNGDASAIRIELAETGEQVITDQHGQFVLQSEDALPQITLLITRGGLNAALPIGDIPDAATHVTVDILVDPETNSAEATRISFDEVKKFGMKAAIVGGCARFFENHARSIRQKSPVPEGLGCVMKVAITGDGSPLGAVLVALQRRGCDPTDQWRQITTEYTPTGVHQGIVQIPFKFYDNVRACYYRALAPADFAPEKQVSVTLETLTAQTQP